MWAWLIGSVAPGGGVSSLFLDDDSLVITGVIGRIHYFFLIITLSFNICCNAHAVLVCLRERIQRETCKISCLSVIMLIHYSTKVWVSKRFFKYKITV